MERKASGAIITPKTEGIKACVLNAERLYKDSLNVTEPTKLALMEIAIEEVSKGWWIAFMLMTSPDNIERTKNRFGELMPIGTSFEKTHKEIVDNPDYKEIIGRIKETITKPIDLVSFRKHKRKLEFMKEVKEYLEFYYPFITSLVDVEQAAKLAKIVGGKYDSVEIPANVLSEAKKHALDPLKGLDDKFFTELDGLKEEGFYVDYKDGEYIQPGIHQYNSKNLENYLKTTLALLKFIAGYY